MKVITTFKHVPNIFVYWSLFTSVPCPLQAVTAIMMPPLMDPIMGQVRGARYVLALGLACRQFPLHHLTVARH